MKIEYNNIEDRFYLYPENPLLTGNVKINYSVNCCIKDTYEASGNPVFIASICKTYTDGLLTVDSIILDSEPYNCQDKNSCLDINVWLADSYTGQERQVQRTEDNDKIYFNFFNFPGNTSIEFNATKGCRIYPIIEKQKTKYVFATGLPDGVIYFSIEKQVDGVLYKEEALYFKDTDLNTLVVHHVANNKDSKAHLIYETIRHGIDCVCNLEDLCYLYKALAIELNIIDKCKTC